MDRGGEQTDARFGAAALSLMAVMARLCGWRPEEFWAATPAEVGAVLKGFASDGASDGTAGGGFGARERLVAMMEDFPDG